MSAPFRVVSPDENSRWPSGESESLAVVALSPNELARRVGVALTTGVEAGMGPWQGVGLEMRSGAPVEFIRYEEGFEADTFCIRADAAADCDRVWSEILSALGLESSAVLWVRPRE